MKCYLIMFSEYRGESPLVEKVYLSKKEADDFVEFKNWQCKDRYRKWCAEHDEVFFDSDVHEILWVEQRELF